VFVGGGFASQQFFAFNAFTGDLTWALRAPDGGPTPAIIKDRWVIFNTESCTLFVADADTGELRWSRWLGDPLMSQPAAAGELVFSAYPKSGGYRFGAFRLTDGEPQWAVDIAADVIQAPQVQGDSVYFSTMAGTVVRLRQRDGSIVWRQDIGAASAVWVHENRLLVSRRVDNGAVPQEQMVVLDRARGRVVRQSETFPAPYLGGDSRDRQLISGQSGAWGQARSGARLGLTNVASGWAFQGSSPAVDNGRAYFAVGGDIQARDMSTGQVVWRRDYSEAAGAQAVSPPAVVGSQIIFGTVDGHLYSADIDTGMTLWAYDLGEPIHFQPIVAQGWVYVATAQGRIIGLELGDPAFDGWHMWGGNAQHAGPVAQAGRPDRYALASLVRPTQGTLRRLGPTAGGEDGNEDETESRPDVPAAAPGGPPELPLVHTDVDAVISGMVAQVVVTQEFRNSHDHPIEALYLFPLPEDAAVDDMEMRLASRTIRGRIQRRAQARQTYSEARAAGRRAALLEQQRPNLFAQRVANIQPGERIEVRLRYVQPLPMGEGHYEFTFPMVAPPRYDPQRPLATRETADDLPSTEAGAPPTVAAPPPAQRAGQEVSLRVRLDAGLTVNQIQSPTHEVEVARQGRRQATVTLPRAQHMANRDFILRYDVAGALPQATGFSHRDEESGYVTLVVQPPAVPEESTIAPRQVLVVIDSSSSMVGRPMEQARAVTEGLLDQLRPEDSFNIFSFSDGVTRLAPQPLPATEANVAQGRRHVAELRARGATEMVPAIRTALSAVAAATSDTSLPLVLLVTDGFIANEAEVFRAVAEGLGETRVYALGLGSTVNRFLLERVAEIGRGQAIIPALSDTPEAVARRVGRLVDRPVFTDLALNWGGLEVTDVYPRRLPDLFAGHPLVVHGRYQRGGEAVIRLRGSIGGRRYERRLRLRLAETARESSPSAAHGTLWARAAIRDRMNRLYLRDQPEVIEEVTRLGLHHRIVTQWTSFVAVDEAPETAANGGETEETVRASLSPARSLPGDPEIRIPAPSDAQAVTVVLPFGESLSARWEPELNLWTARFLVPRDAAEGLYPVRIIISHPDGRQERLRLWYTVDASAPLVEVDLEGELRPGAEILVRARQVITHADLEQLGLPPGRQLPPDRQALILSDARRVQLAPPTGDVVDLQLRGPGQWEGTWRIPDDAEEELELLVVVADLAANVRTQRLVVEVVP
jgi:Ca-activated chloride channel family protein